MLLNTPFSNGEKHLPMNILNLQALTEKKKESLFTALYVGAYLHYLSFSLLHHLSANLWDGLVNFFTSLTLAPSSSTGISLPAPSNPADYMNLYTAAFQFCLAIRRLRNQ